MMRAGKGSQEHHAGFTAETEAAQSAGSGHTNPLRSDQITAVQPEKGCTCSGRQPDRCRQSDPGNRQPNEGCMGFRKRRHGPGHPAKAQALGGAG